MVGSSNCIRAQGCPNRCLRASTIAAAGGVAEGRVAEGRVAQGRTGMKGGHCRTEGASECKLSRHGSLHNAAGHTVPGACDGCQTPRYTAAAVAVVLEGEGTPGNLRVGVVLK